MMDLLCGPWVLILWSDNTNSCWAWVLSHVGGMLIEIGPEGALMNTTRSGVFSIVLPLNSPKVHPTSSSGSSSRTHSTTFGDFQVALFLKFQALFGR